MNSQCRSRSSGANASTIRYRMRIYLSLDSFTHAELLLYASRLTSVWGYVHSNRDRVERKSKSRVVNDM
jgi:hypothetical protein